MSGLRDLLGAIEAIRVEDPDPEVVKACCASVYGLDVVRLFLGDSYHPGGIALTRRLVDVMGLQPGQRVLDVAAGIGTTAFLLADESGVEVTGVDLGPAQVTRARARANELRLGDAVRFEVGDAERLPVDDNAFDFVICECAFCTFPAKEVAAAEMARVLRPGGRVGITDVWMEPDRLAPELAGLAGRVACLADARPIASMCVMLAEAGLDVTTLERHDHALAETIDQVEARIRALKILDLAFLEGIDLDRGTALARQALDAVARGDGGYLLAVAEKPPAAGRAGTRAQPLERYDPVVDPPLQRV